VDDVDVLPVVAFWSAINMVVLFLVCMVALQAPMRRGEGRLEIREPIWIVSSAGMIREFESLDLSLSGAAIAAGAEGPLALRTGDAVRVFVKEVGFVAGSVVRRSREALAVQFDLPPSLERDLLIRKLFTAGLDTMEVEASAWSSTRALFKSIWTTRTDLANSAQAAAPAPVEKPVHKLPARSLVIEPQFQDRRLEEVASSRQKVA
jgi:PilZ domain-containing protein